MTRLNWQRAQESRQTWEPISPRDQHRVEPDIYRPHPKGSRPNTPAIAALFKLAQYRLKSKPHPGVESFVASLSEHLALRGYLTEKQYNALVKIARASFAPKAPSSPNPNPG